MFENGSLFEAYLHSDAGRVADDLPQWEWGCRCMTLRRD